MADRETVVVPPAGSRGLPDRSRKPSPPVERLMQALLAGRRRAS
jgi:hypothetical protein